MARKRLQRVVNHEFVRAKLQRHHEDQQCIREHHRSNRQPGTPRLAPQVSPGQSQRDIHWRTRLVAWIAQVRKREDVVAEFDVKAD